PASPTPFPYTTLFRSRRVVDEQASARGDEAFRGLDVERVPEVAAQRHRDRLGPGKPDHGLVDGKSRVGAEHLVAWADRREDGEEDRKSTRLNSSHLVI